MVMSPMDSSVIVRHSRFCSSVRTWQEGTERHQISLPAMRPCATAGASLLVQARRSKAGLPSTGKQACLRQATANMLREG